MIDEFWSGKLHDPNEDLKDLDTEEDGVLWHADVSGSSIWFSKLTVVKKTPCGYWVEGSNHWGKIWRAENSNKASKTKRIALNHLFARKSSYVRHSRRRLSEAEKQFGTINKVLRDLAGEARS
jgi:hypothetical protein